MGTDFYPSSMEAKAPWHANYQANIGGLAAKYNLTAAQTAAIAADNTWIQFWVGTRNSAAAFASQLAAYFNSISGSDPSLDPPAVPAYEVPDGPPEVPPGIEFRVREIARHIKGHSSYSVADGTLLRIVGEGVGTAGVPKPTIKAFAAASGYEFSIVVSKRGDSDSWQVWAKPAASSDWQILTTATGKSTDVQFPPPEEAAPVQLHVRVQLRRSNEDYGDVSMIGQVTVNP